MSTSDIESENRNVKLEHLSIRGLVLTIKNCVKDIRDTAHESVLSLILSRARATGWKILYILDTQPIAYPYRPTYASAK